MTALFENPIIKKELITRFRMSKNKSAQTAVVIVFISGFLLMHWIFFKWMMDSEYSSQGKDAFLLITGIEGLLVGLVALSIASNAITKEREQQTWEMLIFTRLTPSDIILGKLISRMITIVLVMLLMLPLKIGCAMFSFSGRLFPEFHNYSLGLTFFELAMGEIVMFIGGLFIVTVGIYFSWIFKKTISAIMASYTFVIGFLCIGTLMVAGAIETPHP